MRNCKVIFSTLAACVLLTASISSADARWFGHRGRGPGLGILGGAIVGAATIATLPFALLAGAANAGPPSRGYYDQRAYGPPPGGGYGYGPPQGDYGSGHRLRRRAIIAATAHLRPDITATGTNASRVGDIAKLSLEIVSPNL
jgi:hypothetical protein